MELKVLEAPEALDEVFPVMRELRGNLSLEDYRHLYREARERDQYTIVGLFEGTACLALMGYRILYDFVHGKHLYVDDLVVTKAQRSNGLGARLLTHAEVEARRLGCRGLRLCTGVENEGGKRFYERHGWIARALAFKKRL